MRRSWLSVAILWALIPSWAAGADGPADGLLRLVEPDSGLILAVEDLRGRAREVVGSPLFEGLLRLPTVRTWMASKPFRKAERASQDVQAALGVPLATIRDDLLGDAVVLALHAGPSGRPDQSRGLLLARPRDRALLERLIGVFNDAQFNAGELAGVEARTRGAVKYSARLFKVPRRPPEFYAVLDDGTFAWSNSEPLILGVIDRQLAKQPGLGDNPEFRKVRAGLHDRPLASLFVSSRFLSGALAEAHQPPEGDRLAALVSRYIGAVGLFGVALEWREGIYLHTSESVDPEKLDPWLKTWLTSPSAPVSLPARVSPATVALASANLDFRAFLGGFEALIPEGERPNLDNLKVVLQGILLGRDPITEVLPRLGPGAILAVEIEPDPAIRPHFPLVAAVEWSVGAGLDDLSGPIDNAMRTLLAFHGFVPRRTDRLQIESRSVGDIRVTFLTDGLRTKLAYRVDRDRLVIGTSPEAVARFGAGQPPSTLTAIRARLFPEAETFAIVDLNRLVREVRALRGPIARALAARSKRPVDAADRDLVALIAVADLFQAATFTSATSKDAREVRRTLGLMAR